jgi:chemotaxis response regulator CheB
LGVSRVLVMARNTLFKSALTELLESHSEIIVMTRDAVDVKGLLHAIAQCMPDVIVLEQSLSLAINESLVPLITVLLGLRIIVVSDDSNWLHIHHQDDVQLTSVKDFFDVIQAI